MLILIRTSFKKAVILEMTEDLSKTISVIKECKKQILLLPAHQHFFGIRDKSFILEVISPKQSMIWLDMEPDNYVRLFDDININQTISFLSEKYTLNNVLTNLEQIFGRNDQNIPYQRIPHYGVTGMNTLNFKLLKNYRLVLFDEYEDGIYLKGVEVCDLLNFGK